MKRGFRKGVSWNTKAVFVFAALVSVFFLGESRSIFAAATGDQLARQRNAIAVARTGNYPAAIKELEALRKLAPADASIRYDLIRVNAWSGNCPRALRLYRAVANQRLTESSLTLAVSDCLKADEFPARSLAVLSPALQRSPNDQALRKSYQQAQEDIAKSNPWFSYTGVEARHSDKGSRETRFETELSKSFSEATKGYVRALLFSGIDPVLPDGDLRRVAVGVQHRRIGGLQLKGEVSGGTGYTTNAGWLLRVDSAHSERLTVHGEYTSYNEEVPLPAVAQNITADRFAAGVDYHSSGYEFEGSWNLFRSTFSDSNLRNGVSTNLGYAYHRVPDRWRRVGLELEHEDNSLAGPAYFNPTDANRITVFHSMEFPFRSRFKSHVDTLTIRAGIYAQAGYRSEYVSEARYLQKYTLTDHSWLEWSASIGSNVYDGARETETALQFSYARSF